MKALFRLALAMPLIACLSACTGVKETLFDLGLKGERALSSLNRHELDAAGHHWVYLDSGTPDAPVLLLLHGFAVDKDNWLRFARDFSDYRVIAPDLPGHGESSFDPAQTYDFAHQAQWLDAFVQALDLKQPLHVMGNSMGGGIALMFAAQHPQQVASVTLFDAAGVYPPKASDFQTIIDQGLPNPLVVTSTADYDALREFAMVQQPFLPWPASDVLAARAIARNSINTRIFSDIHNAAEAARGSGDNLQLLQQVTQPVLIVWGEKDRVLDVSSVGVFSQYLPHSQSHVFPDVGHAPMLEVPQQSADLVRGFLSDLKMGGLKVGGLNTQTAAHAAAVSQTE
ncbi:alpha/beta fold hydrolase [Thalassolituus sp. LLYu03]|uniref:alpha/beta fold hydrolase n=1 Tax=Thalassolituus sp. LLYu03 TaxID=3421656 RepID=UPI003D2E0B16